MSLDFITQFVRNAREVGTITESSASLASVVTAAARLEYASAIVEIGPGTGAITKQILEQKSKQARFFAIEINGFFVSRFRERFPGVPIYEDSAEHLYQYLRLHGLQSCDAVISGLPWTLMEEPQQDRLLSAIAAALRKGGRLVTYTYIQSPFLPGGRRFRKKLEEHFSQVEKTPIVLYNLPPAFAYVGKK